MAKPSSETERDENKVAVAAMTETPWLDQVVAATPVPRLTVEEKLTLAEHLSKSGVFPSATDVHKAFAAIEIGQALGMEPGIALMSIDFGAQGKPSISVHWQAAQLQRLGWRWEFLQHDAGTCQMRLYPPTGRGEPFPYGFTMSEAKAIPVYDKAQGDKATLGNKWNYKHWAKDMLYAFVMRRIVHHYEPRVLGGFAGLDEDAQQAVDLGAYEGTPPTEETAQAAVADLFGGEPGTTPLVQTHQTPQWGKRAAQEETLQMPQPTTPDGWRAEIQALWNDLPEAFRAKYQKEVASPHTAPRRMVMILEAAYAWRDAGGDPSKEAREPGQEG